MLVETRKVLIVIDVNGPLEEAPKVSSVKMAGGAESIRRLKHQMSSHASSSGDLNSTKLKNFGNGNFRQNKEFWRNLLIWSYR